MWRGQGGGAPESGPKGFRARVESSGPASAWCVCACVLACQAAPPPNKTTINQKPKNWINTATSNRCLQNDGSVEASPPRADAVSTNVEHYDLNKGSNYWRTSRLDCITLYRGFFFGHKYLHKFEAMVIKVQNSDMKKHKQMFLHDS